MHGIRSCRVVANPPTTFCSARAIDIQLDWVIEDDKRSFSQNLPPLIGLEERQNLLEKLFDLAVQSHFTFVHKEVLSVSQPSSFIHVSCPLKYLQKCPTEENFKVRIV